MLSPQENNLSTAPLNSQVYHYHLATCLIYMQYCSIFQQRVTQYLNLVSSHVPTNKPEYTQENTVFCILLKSDSRKHAMVKRNMEEKFWCGHFSCFFYKTRHQKILTCLCYKCVTEQYIFLIHLFYFLKMYLFLFYVYFFYIYVCVHCAFLVLTEPRNRC